jgi:hypothetical protein
MFFPNEIWMIIKEFVGSYSHNIESEIKKLKTRKLLSLINCTFACYPPKMTTGGCEKRRLNTIEYRNELIKTYMWYFNFYKDKQEKIFYRTIDFIKLPKNEHYYFAYGNLQRLQIDNNIHQFDYDSD